MGITPSDYAVGDTAVMKKPHPCGSDKWQVLRTGADVRLKCLGCERVVMLDAAEFRKKAKEVIRGK